MAELRFDDRVAIVTGGGRGLGRSYALLLAERGAKVVVNDPGVSPQGEGFDAGPAAQVVSEIIAAGGKAVTCTESVATPEGCKAIVQAARDAFGRIDILIHNAGIFRPYPVGQMPDSDYHDVINVHQHAAYHLVRAVFPEMCKAGYGRIVLTSSVLGLYGGAETLNYASAKMAMLGLSHVLAVEGASSGVNCNVICPGAETRMTGPLDAENYPPMTPAQVAPIVAWLCHDQCGISGEIFVAAGGRVARAFIAETPGVYQHEWTLEEIAEQIEAIRDAREPLIFPVVPDGHNGHIRYNFEVIRQGGKHAR